MIPQNKQTKKTTTTQTEINHQFKRCFSVNQTVSETATHGIQKSAIMVVVCLILGSRMGINLP